MSNKLNDIKNTGFKTPKDYFDTVEDAVFSKLKTEDITDNIEDTGFKLPDNYLNTIEDKVFTKLESKDTKVISIFSKRNLLYISSVAAAIVILFSVLMKKEITLDQDLDYDMVKNYIIDQDVSSYELAALLTEEELSSINSEIMAEAFSDEDMEDYLIENINIEDIIEQ